MRERTVKLDPPRISRRDILRAAVALGGGLAVPRSLGAEPPAAPSPASAAASESGGAADLPAPWWLGPAFPRSRVVELHNPSVLDGVDVNEPILADLLAQGLRILTASASPAEAWQRILGDRQRIAVKFNRVGAEELRTTAALARTLVASLTEAGVAHERLTFVEAPPTVVRELGVREPEHGWGPAVPVGGREEPLAAWLYAADAVINVPFLKAHRIAGMSGGMKNLSHALLRRPANYHADGCSPYVGQVIGSSAVSTRLRLTVLNAIRIVLRDGPEVTAENVSEASTLLLGFDPVAVDETGHGLLLAERSRCGKPGALTVPSLLSAAALGIGRREAHALDRVRGAAPG